MRYFLEVAYKGTKYSGFQVQQNAVTIQGEIEKAFQIFFNTSLSLNQNEDGFTLTGSSRTDAGVHALQNFFHFNWPHSFQQQWIYNLNAILPDDIVIKNVYEVEPDAHCRFDAICRTYRYHIYQYKNPFVKDTAYYYPYSLDLKKLNLAAKLIIPYKDFASFSKRHTQVKNFNCNIITSQWIVEHNQLIFEVTANRFLRGMVRALTATMLKVGRNILSIEEFQHIVESKNVGNAFFDVPAHGLTLMRVSYGLDND